MFFRTKKKLEEERLERHRIEGERQRLEIERHRLKHALAERERAEQLARKQLEASRQAEKILKEREQARQREETVKAEIKAQREIRETRQQQEKQRKIKEASPETIRTLRELIREKYRLDVEIWGLRGARKPDRWLVQQRMEKADAVMEEIMGMVSLWDQNRDRSWSPAEWERVQDIRTRLQSGGIRVWAENPLWDEGRGSGIYSH
jgi:cysteinyl-tRNA synthetase